MRRNYGNTAPEFYFLLESKNGLLLFDFTYTVSFGVGIYLFISWEQGKKQAVRNEIIEGSVRGKSREDFLRGDKESYF